MCLKIYLLLLTAPFVFTDVVVDQALLQDVFGNSPAAHASSQQAVAVSADTGTLVDPDYWDAVDDFTPSPLDYDKFDWTLTNRVAVTSEENFLLSPLGLKLALAILTEGATRSTLTELNSVLGFDSNRTNVRRKFSSILNSLQTKSSQYILDLGSAIYVQKQENTEHRQKFASIALEYYKTDMRAVDFNNPLVVAREINDWVSNITHNRIKDLVDADDVAGMVILILNTLYFKGTWRHQFEPNATKLEPFYVTPQLQKSTQFMNVKDKFYYTESAKLDAKILRMPYLGNKFSMYIVVPNSLTGLHQVFANLNEIRSEMYYLQQRSVDVTLPKFYFEYTSHLDGILRELGIRQAFEDTASFPGIARGQSLQQRLRISKVLQRSGIEVNELGSIAYSATEVSLASKFGVDNDTYIEVRANKPFMFYIEDEMTRQLLFTGRVSDPSLSDGALKH